MVFALKIGAFGLKAKSDSQLVSNYVAREYQEKEPKLITYLYKVQSISTLFKSFEVKYQNFKVDILPKLASMKTTRFNQTLIQETLSS